MAKMFSSIFKRSHVTSGVRNPKAADFTMLKMVNCPSILIETDFMTTKWIAERLASIENREEISKVIMNGMFEMDRIWLKESGDKKFSGYRKTFGY